MWLYLFGDQEQRFLYFSTVYLPLSFVGFGVTCTFVSFAYLDPIYVLAAYLAGLYRATDVKLREGGMPAPATASARVMRSGPPLRQRISTLPVHVRSGAVGTPVRRSQ